MDHRHEHGNSIQELMTIHAGWEARIIRRAVMIGCAVNIALMLLKLTFGYYGHSDALRADGFHSLSDVCSDIIMLAFVGISFRPSSRRFTYGYGKFETFASLLISGLLLFVTYHISEHAIESISAYVEGEILPHPDGWTVIAVLVAMGAKECLFHYYKSTGKKTRCAALVSSAWHHRADALASIATLIGVGCAHFLGENWRILDAIASLIIALLILGTGLRLFVRAFNELMDTSLPQGDVKDAERLILNCEGVVNISNIRCRKSGPYMIFNVMVEVEGNLSINEGDVIASQIETSLINHFGSHSLVGVEIKPVEK